MSSRVEPSGFPSVPGGYPFPELELETLEFWRREKVFEASLAAGDDDEPEFSFYEGPPTANNVPHVGHVVTRVVKDIYPRFRTMTGRRVPRKGGWDTHGLPVEIEVEKQFGFSGKQQIEDHGIEKFNRACLESVRNYERQWRRMSERVGYWLDMDDAYRTYRNAYIESEWWALAELWKKDLLYEGRKIQPYCARCGTTLSSHEVAQNYRDTEDPSIWVRFPLRTGQTLRTIGGATEDGETGDGPDGGGAADNGGAADGGAAFGTDRPIDIVAWTTTPWTLLSHAGIAVHPELTYRAVEDPTDPERLLLIAEDLERPVPALVPGDGKPARVDLREAATVARFAGRSLEGVLYDRPFAVEPSRRYRPAAVSDEAGFRILLADYVTLAEGTGAVHTAPLFGEDDEKSGREYGLPELQAVDAEGRVALDAGRSSGDPATQSLIDEIDGEWFKDADRAIVRSLRQRGRLLHGERYGHSYPFCWRCDQPLLYYATTSWFVRTTAARDRLIEKNREVRWRPKHVGEGRFGKWLENVVDWALSRSRYWGTPLPVWKCGDCGETHAVGSFEDLFRRAGKPLPDDPYDRLQFDPHRPFIDDDFHWPCSADGCSGAMKRVEFVIDAWFDSGAMPFAQYHYPFENRETFRSRFPADFISEAVDQTRGWFYTLHVLACLLFDSPAYRNCIVLGHVNDENGRKMSKSRGNVVEPMEVLAETGADALRWYFCVNNPEQPARFSARLVREAAQTFLLPLWNALSFFTIYANLDRWRPGRPEVPFAERGALDRWILLRLYRLVRDTTEDLRGYRTTPAARGVETFLDELTNWYIRRSRDRFWAPIDGPGDGGDKGATSGDGGGASEKESAYQTLYEVLTTLRLLISPFVPFVAEELHRRLLSSQGLGAVSCHLESWPEAPAGRADERLEAAMATVLRIARNGRSARNANGVRIRQPLRSVTLVSADPGLEELVAPYVDLLRDELNVHEVRWAADSSEYVSFDVLPHYPKCGPRFGRAMPAVRAALAARAGADLKRELDESGRIGIELNGETAHLEPDEVEVRLEERPGIAVHGDSELLVALDVELDDDLIAEGLAREVVHRVQNRRRAADLDYADRIAVRYRAAAEVEDAIEAHRDWIRAETLAVAFEAVDGDGLEDAPIEGHAFALAIEVQSLR